MKQVVQSRRAGGAAVVDVPAPAALPGHVLVRTLFSVVSPGTERAASAASAGIVARLRRRPELARRALKLALEAGPGELLRTVQEQRAAVSPVGYSASGVVIEAGEGVHDISPGELVACAGAGHANHAEVIAVPRNLAVRVPPGVVPGDAAFATVGAIALQGVRVTAPTLGETVAVIGLGLIGLLTVQLLRAAGCRVVGMDLDPSRVKRAMELGAHDAVADSSSLRAAVERLTQGYGADAVVLTAATPSSEPVRLAADLCRDKGRVVAVGDVGLDVPRAPFYLKELELRLSRSYGPGRYDPVYEEDGVDYPYGYVRWTEERNMEAFLELLRSGAVTVEPLVTHRFPLERAADAYALLTAPSGSPAAPSGAQDGAASPTTRPLGILIEYPTEPRPGLGSRRLALEAFGRPAPAHISGPRRDGAVRLGMIGAGAFARGVLLPALAGLADVQLVGVATTTGLSARHAAERHGFRYASTDPADVLGDSEIDAVIIATRHDSHASLAAAALQAGKAVYVEKPLGLSAGELREALAAQRQSGRQLMVGLNRRFAPAAAEVRQALANRRAPMTLIYRASAGPLPRDSWIHDPAKGGGRIVSEACHFVDLVQHLAGAPPVRVAASGYASASSPDPDNVAVTLELADGSTGALTYVTADQAITGKERLEGYAESASFVIDDFRSLELGRPGGAKPRRSTWRRPEKGHRQALEAFLRAVRIGEPSPIDPLDAARASLVTFKIREAVLRRSVLEIDDQEMVTDA